MSRKIIGVTVGTPTSPSKMARELKSVFFGNSTRKLLYVDTNGNITPLALGEGLRIVNGVLALDIDIIESVQSLISSDGYVLLDSNGLYLKPKEVTE